MVFRTPSHIIGQCVKAADDQTVPHIFQFIVMVKVKVKGKSVPLQEPEGSRKLRFPDFMTTTQDSGKIASLTHQPPLPQGG